MVSVTITRKNLHDKGSCSGGLELFESVCSFGGSDHVRVPEWTPLHSVWAAVSAGSFANWCIHENLIPWANLEEANLEGANLEGANLRGAILVRANLEEAYLKEANLRGANLEGANLRGAILEEAYLKEANLRGANFKGANLKEANLRGAILEEAYLKGANLERANLEGANLRGAYRGSSPPIHGWRTDAEGYLQVES